MAGLLRPGNAGSDTAADHVNVLDLALAALPRRARPNARGEDSVRLFVRSDSAGATHAFAAALRCRGLEFSLGFPGSWYLRWGRESDTPGAVEGLGVEAPRIRGDQATLACEDLDCV